MIVQNIKEYNERLKYDLNSLVDLIVRNNLNSSVKIASITVKEVQANGKVISRNIDVVDEMFIERDAEMQKVMEEYEDSKRELLEEATIDAGEQGENIEVPVSIIPYSEGDKLKQKEEVNDEVKDLLSKLRNGDNEKKKTLFNRLKNVLG